MRLSTRIVSATTLLIISLFIGACSSDKPFLIVHYQLPSSSLALEGQKVSLAVTDIRENRAFLNENAKKSLLAFNDTYSLVVLEEDGSGNLLGVYDLKALISEIFRQRLANMGMQATPSAESADHELEIILKEFRLDLKDRKWVVSMNYQADLSKNGGITAQESVNGSAERLKVMGKSDAEKLLGELVTDMVNRLDVAKLLAKTQ